MAAVLNSSSASASSPQVVMDIDGSSVAVWAQDGDIWVNRHVPATGWDGATRIEISNGFAEDPQVSIDADGNVTLIWTQDGSEVWASLFEPGG
jgi:hypothetical protein